MPYCCAMRTSPVSATAGNTSATLSRAAPTACGKPRNTPSNIVPPSFLVFYAGRRRRDSHSTRGRPRRRSVLHDRRLENLEEERQADRQAGAGGESDRRLLVVPPSEQLERHDAQSTGEMGSKQDDQPGLGEPYPRALGPAQEGLEAGLALDRPRQRPKMSRKEESEQQPGNPVDEEGPIGRMVARPPVHCRTHVSRTHVKSAPAPRHGVVSRRIVRRPMPPWSAAAAAKTR